MTSVTFPPALGGDGSTVTDDANATTGLANGGHRTRFVAALAQAVAVMSGAVSQVVASAAAALSSQNAAAASATTALNAPGTNATSTTSTSLATGAKTINIQTGKSIVPGMQVMVANTASPATQYMRGTVTAYNTGTGQLDINIDYILGSGTISTWTVSLTGAMDPTRAPIASPTFTGIPAAPTATVGTATTQLATTKFVDDAKVKYSTYASRAAVRSLTPNANDFLILESLGLFVWVSAATDPDDDETCFATASGRWLLIAPHWDVVYSHIQPDLDLLNSRITYGAGVCAVLSIASNASATFTLSAVGAIPGDVVILNSPQTVSARLAFFPYVSAMDSVTVQLNNPSAATESTPNVSGIWKLIVISSRG